MQLFDRDLDRLIEEINNYDHEEDLWRRSGNISNTAGNLCLHIIGNLNHFIGAVLGNTGYVRDREAEFNSGRVLMADLIEQARSTKNVVVMVLRNLKEEDLQGIYPEDVFGYKMSTGYFLVHLLGHLNYHLGQINYHRRILVETQ